MQVDNLLKNESIIDIYEYLENKDLDDIIETLDYCLSNDILSQTTKCHILSSAMAQKNKKLEDYLFSHESYGLREVLKTCFYF